MTSKTLTREDVIRVVSEALETDKHIYFSEVLTKLKAEEIANALGLVAPVPFERVAWAVVLDQGGGAFYSEKDCAETEAKESDDAGYEVRVLPVLIQEISPDDPRLKRGEE